MQEDSRAKRGPENRKIKNIVDWLGWDRERGHMILNIEMNGTKQINAL